MDVFCLEPVLSQIYGRSIPTVNISEMVLQLQPMSTAASVQFWNVGLYLYCLESYRE